MTNDNCDCCEGVTQFTPMKTVNRPGLSALAYRVGTHAAFLETMKARLSSLYLDLPRDEFDEHGQPKTDRVYPLRGLTTRASDDPSIALLDSWATVGAVLTFYQERIANEGYLNTATERRSILELARLVGYQLRPGVSASTFLAYTIDTNAKEVVEIPAGSKVQSVPNPGELPQTFETSEALEARAAWNNLKPRQTRPQIASTIASQTGTRVYLKGTSTNLKENDPLLIDFGSGSVQLFRILQVTTDTTLDRTLVTLTDWQSAAQVAGNFKARVLKLAQTLQDTSSLRRTTAKAEMVGRAIEHLQKLERAAQSTAAEGDVAKLLKHETLPRLQEELAVAEADVKFAKVKPWLEQVIKQLQSVAQSSPTETLKVKASAMQTAGVSQKFDPLIGVIQKLTLPPSVPPRNTLNLARDVKTTFAQRADIGTQLVATFEPKLQATLSAAISNGTVTTASPIHVYALRVKASPFGHNAPLKITSIPTGQPPTTAEWSVSDLIAAGEAENVINLDASYDKILPDSWVVIDMAAVDDSLLGGVKKVSNLIIAQTQNPNAQLSRAAYSVSGKTTCIQLVDASGKEQHWFEYITIGLNIAVEAATAVPNDFQIIRRTAVYTQSEELPLAEEPIESNICNGASGWIELDGLYSDLKSGRWLIVSGERTDITVPDPNQAGQNAVIRGVTISELVMLDDVIQDTALQDGTPASDNAEPEIFELPGEKTHTFIKFAKDLEYCYRRDSVTIYGNVVKATHGETRKEVLGSGDGSQVFQSFTLKQPPLTYVAASNPSGVDSTLKVYVNEVQWHEMDSLAGLAATDRDFITRADDAGKTTVIFGNGKQGARLPTGRENVRAEYRQGIGQVGNVKAGQLSQLLTRPLGVKDVINPLRASGGADKENRDQARKNAPLAVLALDRLVSVSDYADFTRTFAGIGKAAATTLSVAQRQIVHVTIAGADDIPIDPTSDLYRNLLLAIRQNGDPYQPFQVDLRELLLLVISANVKMQADYVWENVVTQVRTKLLDTFNFERRDLGQDVFFSEVISTMQGVPGVEYVDVDLLAAIPEKIADNGTRRLLTPEEITAYVAALVAERASEQNKPDMQKKHPVSRIDVGLAEMDQGTVRPAQLALLSPTVSDTLILNRI
jgi:hypothetical protein